MKTIFNLFDSIESKIEKYCKGRNNEVDNTDINIINDTNKLRKILHNNKNINVNNITFDGWSPLHLACASGRLHIVECLFHDGKADPNVKSIHELMTPLHVCCWNGHINVVKYLIENEDARIVDTSEFGYTSLHYASKNGKELVCKYLCQKGIDVNAINDEDQTALLLAAKHGHIDIVKYLISIPHIQINRPDLQYCTALHHACWEGNVSIMKLLIQSNAALTLRDVYDRTPLDVCKTPEMKHIMKNYIESAVSKAEINSTTSEVIEFVAATEDIIIEQCWDLCTIHEQSKENCNKIKTYDDKEDFQTMLQLLSVHPHLKIGYLKYKNSKTLLMEAAQNGKITVCQLLLTEGAEPMNIDVNGFTALHLASLNGHENIVKLFLTKCKMSPDVCNKMNRAPIHCAAQNGHINVIKVILDYNGNIHAKDKNGYNVLHFACFHNHDELVDYLLSNSDINVNCATNSMETALDLTSSKQIQDKLKSTMVPTIPSIINEPISKSVSKLSIAASIKNSKRESFSSSSISVTTLNPKSQGVSLANTIQGQRKQLSQISKSKQSSALSSNPSATFREKLKQLRNKQGNIEKEN